LRFAAAQGLLEAAGGLRSILLAGVPDKRDEDERRHDDDPDRQRARRRELGDREQADECDGRHDRGPHEAPREPHAGISSEARSSSRTATSASTASSLIDGSGSWWLNLAHSKRSVSLRTASALVWRERRARSTYSSGASAGRRGMPA